MSAPKLYFVVKQTVTTRFMQDADMFEEFKFAGEIVRASYAQKPGREIVPKDVLATLTKEPCDAMHEIVGVIIPGFGSAFKNNHKVLSTGGRWSTIEDVVKGLKGNPLEYVA